MWLLSSFNFYLITFYLKSFPGNIYVNSLCFAFADFLAFIASGCMLKCSSISFTLAISYSLSLIAGINYLVFYESKNPYVIPLIVCVSRIGGSMSYNVGYISVAMLFPTEYVSTVFGLVNFVSHLVTVGAPLVAEIHDPVPFIVFCFNAGIAIFAAMTLKEIKK